MSLNDRVPQYLLGKYQLTATVTFTALFALVFLMMTVPFDKNAWFDLGDTSSFLYSVSYYFLSLSFVAVSRRVMYLTRNSLNMTMLQYGFWCAGEILVLCILYTFMTMKGMSCGIIKEVPGMTTDRVFMQSMVYGLIGIGVPYVISSQYFAINDRDNTIRLMNYGNVVTDSQIAPEEEQKITLFDNSGVMKLVVSLNNLYYIESDDNYIKVWYSDNGGNLRQYMLRCRLKTVEDSFADSGLVRCHRKYVVNIQRVVSVKHESGSYSLDLGLEDAGQIPVSKTYESRVMDLFNSR